MSAVKVWMIFSVDQPSLLGPAWEICMRKFVINQVFPFLLIIVTHSLLDTGKLHVLRNAIFKFPDRMIYSQMKIKEILILNMMQRKILRDFK